MIEIRKLNKFYNKDKENELHVLKDLDFTLNSNEYVSIMGTSGIGKSTLLNIIGCLETFQNGEYFFDGKDISKLKLKEIENIRGKDISFIFQDYMLIEEDTVIENVKTPLYFDSKVPLKEINKKAYEALHKVGYGKDFYNKKVSKLSGGQKQRVSIARALVNNPKLILADEPTGALDESTSEEIMQLFRTLISENISIIIVTHDINVARQTDKIYEIIDGKVLLKNM